MPDSTVADTFEPSQTYLITGGAGFIGSHLARTLLEQGHRVLVIDDLSTGRLSNIQPLLANPAFHFARASITDEIVMDRMASQADVIVHLAAAVGVKLIVENPVHTIETNVMGTDAVLRSAYRYGARLLVASTSEVYGKGASIPFSEDDDVVLGPTSRNRWGYAASKMVDEFLALAYYREKDLPVVIFRLFNTVGPRQTGRYGMVIPRFVQQALQGEELTVYGDGQQARCFLHVADAVRAIVSLATCPTAAGKVFNIGGEQEVSILELAERVLDQVAAIETDQLPAAYAAAHRSAERAGRLRLVPYEEAYSVGFEDMRRRVPDLSRINTHIGWQPRLTLDDILQDVLAQMLAEAAASPGETQD
jgi:UDP-glucose 4-epimerase